MKFLKFLFFLLSFDSRTLVSYSSRDLPPIHCSLTASPTPPQIPEDFDRECVILCVRVVVLVGIVDRTANMVRLFVAILTALSIMQHSRYSYQVAFAAGPTTKATTYNYLFNLDDDPNEDVNLWDEVEYVNLKKNFEERLTYWLDYLIDPQV